MKTTTWMTRTTAFVMVALLVLSGLSAALSPAFAARADGETVNFALVPTAAAPGAFGQGTLTLRSDAAGQELEATANAVGLPPSRHITLCLTDPSGNTLLLDKDDDRKDNETSVSLRQKLFVSFTTLLGVTVSIRQSPSSDKCEGTVLLSYTVSSLSSAPAPAEDPVPSTETGPAAGPATTGAPTTTAGSAPTATPGPAATLQGQEVRFKATVVRIWAGAGNSQQWRIGDFIFQVDASTRLVGNPGVGNQVEVRAVVGLDGTAVATRISNLSSAPAGVSDELETDSTDAAQAGEGDADTVWLVREKQDFAFTPSGVVPGVNGQGVVELRIDASGRKRLSASAALEGMPRVRFRDVQVQDDAFFSLCLGSTLMARGDTDEDPLGGVLALVGQLLDQQVSMDTLEGMLVTVRQGSGCTGSVLLSHRISGIADRAGAAVQEVRFAGLLASISGNVWRIGDFLVQVDASTRLDGDPGIGDQVEVRVLVQADGTSLATRIVSR